jgi:hypothetical protein
MAAKIRRRILWILALLLLLGTGYTAGYLLSPPEKPTVSRTLPEAAPMEAPQPNPPIELPEEI